jgi:hypothetical protein
MEYQGSLFAFGDLVHLTAAAECVTGIELGTNSCDPWQRAFNQNLDVPRVLNFIGLTNVNLLGISSYVLLTLLLVFTIRKQKLTNISLVIFIFSPPFVLAVDRGNEVITISLIILGFIALDARNKYIKAFSVLFLFAAVFFKLWPILLVTLLAIFGDSNRRKYLISVFVFSVGYWISNIHEIPKMLSATQNGSPTGVAFGLKLFFSDSLPLVNVGFLLTLSVIISLVWIYRCAENFSVTIKSMVRDRRMAILIPILLTYVGIWILGDSFIYRMLILLPALLILICEDLFDYLWVKALVVLILVTVLSSRLAITPAISSSLAFVILFISFIYTWLRIQNYISQRQVSINGVVARR